MRRALIITALLVVAVSLWWTWARPELGRPQVAWKPAVAAAPSTQLRPKQRCTDYEETRSAFFGDLHVHTNLSMDARSRDMLSSPEDAYRFARGETVGFGPFDPIEGAQRKARLRRALDFAAVTDHAEWMGEVTVCTHPQSPMYDAQECKEFRGEAKAEGLLVSLLGGSRFLSIASLTGRVKSICGEDNLICRDALKNAWELNQQATERYYDRSSDCEFTTFHGWEYSDSVMLSKVHRNVIFRNELVPELPVSSIEMESPDELWRTLDELCNQTGNGCESLTIPHNPNVSNGRMFTVRYKGEKDEEQIRQASLRGRMEPLVEMMQIKGESECRGGLWQVFGEDEQCDFEKMRVMSGVMPPACEGDYGSGAIRGAGCQSRLDFARYALVEGLVEKDRIGVNPYRFGMIGSTDNHNAAPGDVDENQFKGCCANTDTTPEERLDPRPQFAGSSRAARNPGGLVGLWAEENSRDSLFDAMQRREAFATSGPRIEPRLFAGDDIPANSCEEELAELGYQHGVPMGAELNGTSNQKGPIFAVAASADPEGVDLQQIQIIKAWHDGEGNFHQRVTTVAGNPDNGASVELQTCGLRGRGDRQLCTTWQDPAFDAGQSAVYYARILENPSCRWSWAQCLNFPEDERPASCNDANIARVIQERAWTSPIWFNATP